MKLFFKFEIIIRCSCFLSKFKNEFSFIFHWFKIDSPYHDVSGLPESYMEQVNMDDPNVAPQQHLSQSYDDGIQESGYSTPNSRNRRVIREIIV